MAAPKHFLLTGVICSILATYVDSGSEDARIGTVRQISAVELDSIVGSTEDVLAFFYKNPCSTPGCISAEEEVELAQKHCTLPHLKVVKLHDELKAKEYGIDKYPNLIFFRNGSPNLYPEEKVDMESVIEWVEGTRDEVLRVLDDDTFEHLTQAASGATTGDWLIIFYDYRCSSLLPTLRAVGNRLRQRAVVGRVDTSKNPGLQRRFKISKCPTIKFFRLGNMYDFTLPMADVTTVVNFAEGWYKNSRSVLVPVDQSPFDRLVESIVNSLKTNLTERTAIYIFGAITVFLFAILILVFRMGGHEKTE